MPIDTTASAVATNALRSIPFGDIIGSPLTACIEAQAKAAQTTWEFINQVGLSVDPTTGEKKAVQVVFQYQRDGRMVNIVVPLLAIVPIPYISIDSIEIDFKANISASSSTYSENTTSEESKASGKAHMEIGWGFFKASLDMEASYSSKKDSKATSESKYSVEYTMDVNVKAGQASMPAGLATVLNLLGNSMTEANPTGSIALDRQLIIVDGDTPALEAHVKGPTGLLAEGVSVKFVTTGGDADKVKIFQVDGKTAIPTEGLKTDANGVARVVISGLDDNKVTTLKVTATKGDKLSKDLDANVTVNVRTKTKALSGNGGGGGGGGGAQQGIGPMRGARGQLEGAAEETGLQRYDPKITFALYPQEVSFQGDDPVEVEVELKDDDVGAIANTQVRFAMPAAARKQFTITSAQKTKLDKQGSLLVNTNEDGRATVILIPTKGRKVLDKPIEIPATASVYDDGLNRYLAVTNLVVR